MFRLPESLTHLVCEQVGIIAWINPASSASIFADGTQLVSAASGDLSELAPGLQFNLPADPAALGGMVGAGCAASAAQAATKAIFETLERYGSAIYAPDEVVTACGADLGADAMPGLGLGDFAIRPNASAAWVSTNYDPDLPIRWVKGYHLLEERPVWVPLAIAHIHVGLLPAECFPQPGTAGVAAHRTLEAALLSAWYEALERDMVELVWRLKMPLPPIAVDGSCDAGLAQLVACDHHAFVDQRYYDATSDLGVPTAYAVRRIGPPLGRKVIVTCATAGTLTEAVVKARRDAAGQQLAWLHAREQGAVAPESDSDPDLRWLETALPPVRLPPQERSIDPLAALRALRRNFARMQRDVVAVNLTPDELKNESVHIVRVIIPSLMSVSQSPNEQFLDHPRLAEAAAHYGLSTIPAPVRDQQPFC